MSFFHKYVSLRLDSIALKMVGRTYHKRWNLRKSDRGEIIDIQEAGNVIMQIADTKLLKKGKFYPAYSTIHMRPFMHNLVLHQPQPIA